jgi:hypothetical protein
MKHSKHLLHSGYFLCRYFLVSRTFPSIPTDSHIHAVTPNCKRVSANSTGDQISIFKPPAEKEIVTMPEQFCS